MGFFGFHLLNCLEICWQLSFLLERILASIMINAISVISTFSILYSSHFLYFLSIRYFISSHFLCFLSKWYYCYFPAMFNTIKKEVRRTILDHNLMNVSYCINLIIVFDFYSSLQLSFTVHNFLVFKSSVSPLSAGD